MEIGITLKQVDVIAAQIRYEKYPTRKGFPAWQHLNFRQKQIYRKKAMRRIREHNLNLSNDGKSDA